MIYKDSIPEMTDYRVLCDSTQWPEFKGLGNAEFSQALNNSRFCVSVYDDSRLVGFGRVVTDGILYAAIYDVMVLPEYQGQGIGTEVVRRLLNKCAQVKLGVVQLFAASGTENFYHQLGFERRPDDAPGMFYAGARTVKPDQ